MDAITPVAAQVKAPDFDPLATVGKLQGVQQGILNNRLLGLQVAGKQALGQIIGANTDPQTGEGDWGKAGADASSRPEAAILMPEIQKAAIDRQISQQQLAGTTLDTQAKRAGLIANTAGSLLSTPEGKLTPDMVMGALSDRLVGSGIFSDKASLTQLASLSQQIQGMTDQQLRQIIQQYGQAADMTTARIATQFAQQNGGLTPDQYNTQTALPVQDAKGNWIPTQRRLGDVVQLEKTGGPIVTGPGTTPEGVPLASAGNPVYTRTNPTTLQPEAVTQGAAAHAAATGAAPVGIVTGPRVGAQGAAAATAQSNPQQAQALQQRAAIVPTRKAALSNLLNTVDQFSTGPAAGKIGQLQSLAAQFGIAPTSINASAGARDEFNKLASRIAPDQGGALGGTGSNEQLGASVKSNPNEAMTKMGIKNVVPLLLGNEDAIGTQAQAWNKYKAVHGADSYGDFLNGWNKYYDPRVFQADHMTPAARNAMLSKMSKSERATFDRDSSVMHQLAGLGQ